MERILANSFTSRTIEKKGITFLTDFSSSLKESFMA